MLEVSDSSHKPQPPVLPEGHMRGWVGSRAARACPTRWVARGGVTVRPCTAVLLRGKHTGTQAQHARQLCLQQYPASSAHPAGIPLQSSPAGVLLCKLCSINTLETLALAARNSCRPMPRMARATGGPTPAVGHPHPPGSAVAAPAPQRRCLRGPTQMPAACPGRTPCRHGPWPQHVQPSGTQPAHTQQPCNPTQPPPVGQQAPTICMQVALLRKQACP